MGTVFEIFGVRGIVLRLRRAGTLQAMEVMT
jgi:hypothetical protein